MQILIDNITEFLSFEVEHVETNLILVENHIEEEQSVRNSCRIIKEKTLKHLRWIT